MNKKTLIALFVLGLLMTVGVNTSFAFQGSSNTSDLNHSNFRQGLKFDAERHQSMQEAMQNKDYSTCLQLLGNRPIAEKIDQENFEKFVEAWQLRADGNVDESKKIMEELGGPKGSIYE